MSTEDVGSPPRMRGKESLHTPTCRNTGITPAYAGKSLYVGLNFAQTEGSPPRMRGKASLAQIEECNDGITPAYAGKRKASGRHQHCGEDHPRVCGEKFLFLLFTQTLLGSPPRMRGKALSTPKKNTVSRITPAYAGKSRQRRRRGRRRQDHPRVCGEKRRRVIAATCKRGSPPRMRGKALHVDGNGHLEGITPAYAGKSDAEYHSRWLA